MQAARERRHESKVRGKKGRVFYSSNPLQSRRSLARSLATQNGDGACSQSIAFSSSRARSLFGEPVQVRNSEKIELFTYQAKSTMTPRLLFHPFQQLTTLRWLSLVPGTPKSHVRMKESVRPAAKKHNDAFYLENFRMLREESKAALVNRLMLTLKEYHTSLGDSLKVNPKRFINYFRHKTKSNSIPANVTYGGRQISTGEVAEAFNEYFHSLFTHAPEVPLDAFTPPDEGMPVRDSFCAKMRSIRCSWI